MASPIENMRAELMHGEAPADVAGAVAALQPDAPAEPRRGRPVGSRNAPKLPPSPPPVATAPAPRRRYTNTEAQQRILELEAQVAASKVQLAGRMWPEDFAVKQAERALKGACVAIEVGSYMADAPLLAPDEEQASAIVESGAIPLAPYMERAGWLGTWLPFVCVLLAIAAKNVRRYRADQEEQKKARDRAKAEAERATSPALMS